MQKLILPYPPSNNNYWRTRVAGRRAITYISKAGMEYRDAVALAVDQAMDDGFAPLASQPVELIIDVFVPDARKRDIDNVTKATLDALTHAGVWDDDNQVERIHINRMRDESGELIKLGCLAIEIHPLQRRPE